MSVKWIEKVIRPGDCEAEIDQKLPLPIMVILEGYSRKIQVTDGTILSYKSIFDDVDGKKILKSGKIAASKIESAIIGLIRGLDGYSGTTIKYSNELGGLFITYPNNESTRKDFAPTQRKLTPLKKTS